MNRMIISVLFFLGATSAFSAEEIGVFAECAVIQKGNILIGAPTYSFSWEKKEKLGTIVAIERTNKSVNPPKTEKYSIPTAIGTLVAPRKDVTSFSYDLGKTGVVTALIDLNEGKKSFLYMAVFQQMSTDGAIELKCSKPATPE